MLNTNINYSIGRRTSSSTLAGKQPVVVNRTVQVDKSSGKVVGINEGGRRIAISPENKSTLTGTTIQPQTRRSTVTTQTQQSSTTNNRTSAQTQTQTRRSETSPNSRTTYTESGRSYTPSYNKPNINKRPDFNTTPAQKSYKEEDFVSKPTYTTPENRRAVQQGNTTAPSRNTVSTQTRTTTQSRTYNTPSRQDYPTPNRSVSTSTRS